MNRDSNAYTFGFAAAMVIVVASVLAFTASSLKGLQQENVRKEKMQNILGTIGIETDRDGAETLFNDHIVSQLALRNDGTVDETVDPFSGIKLAFELKKEPSDMVPYPRPRPRPGQRPVRRRTNGLRNLKTCVWPRFSLAWSTRAPTKSRAFY